MRTAQTGLTKVVSQVVRVGGSARVSNGLAKAGMAAMARIVAMVDLMSIFLEFMN